MELVWLVCPVDADSGGVEIAAVWASALVGGQHGDGEQGGEDGAAAAQVEPVGAVGGGAVPDLGDVGLPGRSDQRVNPGSGDEDVFDFGEPGAEFVGAGAQLSQGDSAFGKAVERWLGAGRGRRLRCAARWYPGPCRPGRWTDRWRRGVAGERR